MSNSFMKISEKCQNNCEVNKLLCELIEIIVNINSNYFDKNDLKLHHQKNRNFTYIFIVFSVQFAEKSNEGQSPKITRTNFHSIFFFFLNHSQTIF